MIINSYVTFAQVLMNTTYFYLLVLDGLWRRSLRTLGYILIWEGHCQFGLPHLPFLFLFLTCHGLTERWIVPWHECVQHLRQIPIPNTRDSSIVALTPHMIDGYHHLSHPPSTPITCLLGSMKKGNRKCEILLRDVELSFASYTVALIS